MQSAKIQATSAKAFKSVEEQISKAYALFELFVPPHSSPSPHIHSQEEEAFYIQSGSIEFELDEQTIVATAGTFLHSPKGQLHRFTNIGSTPAKLLCWAFR